MGDDFSCCERSQPSAHLQRHVLGVPEQKARSEHVAGPSGVDDMGHVLSRHVDDVLSSDDRRAARSASDDCKRAVSPNGGDSRLERVRLVERQQFLFVPEEDVDLICNESSEILTMPVDAKAVREAERHFAIGPMGNGRGMSERTFGIVSVEEIALHVENLACSDESVVDVEWIHE